MILMKQTSIILYLLLSSLTALPVAATSVLPVTLEQLSIRANIIFYGKVVRNEVKKDAQSGQIATFTTFEVIDLIKGNTGASHTIKQLGGKHEDSHTHLLIYGVPQFSVDQEYVVFLPKKSSLGFSSPIGLQQGSFSVNTQNGEKIVGNGSNLANQPTAANADIQIPLAVRADEPAQAHLSDFINTVRAYNVR
ncbi:hypothetical protein MNBD_GAMMA06-1793 [hydrothermal vent metagenome]|uniref:Uncharacterized protein n=1 Tax=hydrothermal vent metagenome TaxID=652676 RepID=A0A3B0WEM5_9ZZZZ